MTDLDQKILAFAQYIARSMIVWSGPMDTLAKLIADAMAKHGIEAAPARIATLLRRPAIRSLLSTHYETELFTATNGEERLVCTAVQTNPAAARKRLAQRPASPAHQCRFCLVYEDHPERDLRPELHFVTREPIPGSFVHRRCARSWSQLRYLAEHCEVTA